MSRVRKKGLSCSSGGFWVVVGSWAKWTSFAVQLLDQEVDSSWRREANILRPLQKHHSRDSTIIPEITDDLQSLLTNFQKLSQLNTDPQYEPNFVKVQEPIRTLCYSVQFTLDDLLQVLTAEPPSDETMSMQLTMLTMRMAAEEKVGLPERLRWYSASVLGLLKSS